MADSFIQRLNLRVAAQQAAGLGRTAPVPEQRGTRCITLDGTRMLNFASNDYLGLAEDAAWRAEVAACFACHAPSGSASRLAGGHSALVVEAEAAWAAHFGHECCLFMPSGYQANLAVITGLLAAGDTVFFDRRIHASMARALPLCGALPHAYPHADLARLEQRLASCRDAGDPARKLAATASSPPTDMTSLPVEGTASGSPVNARPVRESNGSPVQHPAAFPVILTESLFSMDGTSTDMNALAAIRQRHNAFVILDEAHACGALGSGGRGLAWQGNEQAAPHPVADVVVGTLGKAPGFFGAFILMPQAVRAALEHLASALIHSTALPEAHAAATLRLLPRMAGMEAQREKLAHLGARMRRNLAALGLPLHGAAHIIGVELGNESLTQTLAQRLRQRGIFTLAARHPTVPAGKAMLRFSVTAAHEPGDMDHCTEVLKECLKSVTSRCS